MPNVRMTNQIDPIGRLQSELEKRSRSVAGRRAIVRLKVACSEIGEAESLLELSCIVARAAAGQGDLELTNDLILRAPGDPDVGLLVLAGFGQALDLICRLVLRSAPSALDVRSEAVAFAWEAIVEAGQSSQADLARFVARTAWSRTWSASRRECRAIQRFGYTPGADLLETSFVESAESGCDHLFTWVLEGIVSESQMGSSARLESKVGHWSNWLQRAVSKWPRSSKEGAEPRARFEPPA